MKINNRALRCLIGFALRTISSADEKMVRSADPSNARSTNPALANWVSPCRVFPIAAIFFLLISAPAYSQQSPATQPGDAAPTTAPAGDQTNFGLGPMQIDVKKKQIRVECQALNVNMPLEFFCVMNGGPEHETVLRTAAKPSSIHFGLLALGLTPGQPAHYDKATNTWYPPTGAPLQISCEYQLKGKTITVPANRMMRSVKTKQEMPAFVWVFDGSSVMPDGTYAADITCYVVSIVNFDLTMIDVPELASNANETLEWEYNPDLVPPKGTKVTMIIEPAKDAPATQPVKGKTGDQYNPGPGLHGGN